MPEPTSPPSRDTAGPRSAAEAAPDRPATSSGRDDHRAAAPEAVTIALVTISDTRTTETDASGDWLEAAALRAGHRVVERRIVKDDPDAIRRALVELLGGPADVVLSSGGTGIAGRDHTVPVVESLIVKPLPGFGELFRMVSYDEVGAAAMLSRALGGVAAGALLFALPGSSNAVATAWDKLLGPELEHLVFEMLRQRG